MSKGHLFSVSLFNTLFRHNLISSDGYVKATDDQILEFRKFLVQQFRDKTTNIYKVRKKMVDEVSDLLKEDELTPKEIKRLVLLLQQLNLTISDGGVLEVEQPNERKPRYLGASEPKESTWERQLVEEERRLKVLRRDLKELDDWLDEISKSDTKVRKFPPKTPEESKKDEKRYRERTARRNVDMDRARHRLIKAYHAENAKYIKKTLAHKEYPGRVHFRKSVASEAGRRFGSKDSFVTADTEFSFLLRVPFSVTERDIEQARNILYSCDEEEYSHLKVKKSRATEKIHVQPEVRLGVEEKLNVRAMKDVTTYVSEPTMIISEQDFGAPSKARRYSSDITLDGNLRAIGSTIDEAKQYITIYGEEGKDTEFKLTDDEPIAPVKIDGTRPKSILKVSRKSISRSSSSSKGKKLAPMVAREDKDDKNRPTSKRQSADNIKGQKISNSTALRRKKDPKVVKELRDVKHDGKVKNQSNSKTQNKPKITNFKDNNMEKKAIMKTRDEEDGTKHQINDQLDEKFIKGSITPKGDKRVSKERTVEYKGHKNRPISKRQSTEDRKEGKTTNFSLKRKNVPEITKRAKDAKIYEKQKIIDSKDNNDEMGSILKTKDDEDENKLQAERDPNLTQGKVDNKDHEELRDKNVKNLPKLESAEVLSLEEDFKMAQLIDPNKDGFADDKNKTTTDNQEKNIDSGKNSQKKEDSSKSDNEGNVEERPKLKENKKDAGQSDKIIKGRPETESKEDQVLREEQHLNLDEDFELAQKFELGKFDPESSNEERFVSNAGSEENIKDIEDEDEQKDDNIHQQKDIEDTSDSTPEDVKPLTLDQQLSWESELKSRESKERRQRKSKVNRSQNDGNINVKNGAGMSDSSKNAKKQTD